MIGSVLVANPFEAATIDLKYHFQSSLKFKLKFKIRILHILAFLKQYWAKCCLQHLTMMPKSAKYSSGGSFAACLAKQYEMVSVGVE